LTPVMRDDDRTDSRGEERAAEIVARCGNIFVRYKLSPPAALRDAARHWLGLTPDEIAMVLYEHMDRHRRGYHTGSGDQLFHVLQTDIRRAWQVKHPAIDREPERPRRPRQRVVKLHNPSGFADVFVEGSRTPA
jgi:hypothetical protein